MPSFLSWTAFPEDGFASARGVAVAQAFLRCASRGQAGILVRRRPCLTSRRRPRTLLQAPRFYLANMDGTAKAVLFVVGSDLFADVNCSSLQVLEMAHTLAEKAKQHKLADEIAALPRPVSRHGPWRFTLCSILEMSCCCGLSLPCLSKCCAQKKHKLPC